MNRLMRSLRFRLAATSFLTAYAPTFLLLVIAAGLNHSKTVTTEFVREGTQSETTHLTTGVPMWVAVTVTVGFVPFAAAFAWWWSGRAIRPVAEAVKLQEQLMEETSHELRTPLSILSNNAEVLLNHPEPTMDVYRQGLQRTENAAKRMTETIDSLLVDARGRARTINRSPTDIAQVVASVVDSVADVAAGRDVKIDGQKVLEVQARVDVSSVERAITNLVTNAIQHSPAGGTVYISSAEVNNSVEVSVTDSGPGIAPENQTKIFDRYWQSESSSGSGIGLAIVRHVAIAHGGTITVHSPTENGSGSRFCLRLKI